MQHFINTFHQHPLRFCSMHIVLCVLSFSMFCLKNGGVPYNRMSAWIGLVIIGFSPILYCIYHSRKLPPKTPSRTPRHMSFSPRSRSTPTASRPVLKELEHKSAIPTIVSNLPAPPKHALPDRNSKTLEVVGLGPGFALIKNALSEELQAWLASAAMYAGHDRQKGFWSTSSDGQRSLNATEGRGRIYQALTRYTHHTFFQDVCLQLVRLARTKASGLPNMTPTHMLLLYYATAQGMGWHRDSDENDGDNDEPIVSISLGNSSTFGYKALLKPEASLVVTSGDVLVWGGPQRMLEHTVRDVTLGTCPAFLQPIIGNARINYTFRSAPNILGKEDEFETGKYWVDPS